MGSKRWSRRQEQLYGLKPETFGADGWKVDQDYLDKLSDEEKRWLSAFNEEFYKGEYNRQEKHAHGKEHRAEVRAAHADARRRRRDRRAAREAGAVLPEDPPSAEGPGGCVRPLSDGEGRGGP